MMMWLLLCLALSDVGAPGSILDQTPPAFHIHEAGPLKDVQGIGYPYDALLHDDRLYVADYYGNLMVFTSDELIQVFGARGEGPMELKHPPVALDVIDDRLAVIEMYGWNRSFYTFDGQFIEKERLNRNWAHSGSIDYRELNWSEAKAAGVRYLQPDGGCTVSRVQPYSHENYHLAKALILQGSGKTYVVRRSGVVETYDQTCRIINEFTLPVELLKETVTKDAVGTGIAQKVERSQGLTTYRFGVPVISAALEKDDYLWMLVSNERLENRLRKPEESWLYRVSTDSGEVVLKTKLSTPAERVRISADHLILIATEYADIKAWPLSVFND